MSVDVNSLKKTTFFTYLNDEELNDVSNIVLSVDYDEESIVFGEGFEGQTLYLIKSGEVQVTKKDPSGAEQVLALLKEGDIFGEMSFIDGRPHSATIKAVHKTELFQIEKSEFDKLVEKNPKVAYKIMKTIVVQVDAIVRRMNTKYMDMLSYMFGRRRF